MTTFESFDKFRAGYQGYTFEDKKVISSTLYDLYPEQNHANKEGIRLGLVAVNACRRVNTIIELGCWTCNTAEYILGNDKKIEKYYGYDIEEKAIKVKVCNDERLECRVLTTDFWKDNLPKADCFISSHTLEHFNNDEFYKIIDKVADNVFGLVLEIPLKDDWTGFNGTHVLTLDLVTIDDYLISKGFRCVYMGAGVRAYYKEAL